MRRLVAAGLLPERAGQPAKVWAHISLADLLMLDGSSALQQEWTAGVRAQWAAHRAAAARIGLGGVTGWIIRPVTPPVSRVSLVLRLLLEFLLLEFSFG